MSAITDIQKLILWARKNAIAWDTLTVGNVTVNGGDMRASEGLPIASKSDTPTSRAANMYQRYGGAVLEVASQSEGMTSVVEEDP